MAYREENLAYDLSLFEESSSLAKKSKEEKVNKIVKLDVKPREKAKPKSKPLAMAGYVIVGLITVATVIAMICGQAQLTELNQQVSQAKSTLEEKESIYIQTQMKVETELSPEVIEHYACNVLGMVKVDNSKKEFIRLSEGDEAIVINDSNSSVGSYLSDKITSLWE